MASSWLNYGRCLQIKNNSEIKNLCLIIFLSMALKHKQKRPKALFLRYKTKRVYFVGWEFFTIKVMTFAWICLRLSPKLRTRTQQGVNVRILTFFRTWEGVLPTFKVYCYVHRQRSIFAIAVKWRICFFRKGKKRKYHQEQLLYFSCGPQWLIAHHHTFSKVFKHEFLVRVFPPLQGQTGTNDNWWWKIAFLPSITCLLFFATKKIA